MAGRKRNVRSEVHLYACLPSACKTQSQRSLSFIFYNSQRLINLCETNDSVDERQMNPNSFPGFPLTVSDTRNRGRNARSRWDGLDSLPLIASMNNSCTRTDPRLIPHKKQPPPPPPPPTKPPKKPPPPPPPPPTSQQVLQDNSRVI
jgi:hypothetical protein